MFVKSVERITVYLGEVVEQNIVVKREPVLNLPVLVAESHAAYIFENLRCVSVPARIQYSFFVEAVKPGRGAGFMYAVR